MTDIGRVHSEETYLRLIGKVRELTRKCGGVECAADVTRVSFGTLSRYQRVQSPEYARIDVIIDLEKDCGVPVVSAAMARASGHALVKLPDGVGRGDVVGTLGRLHAELADVTGRIGQCLANDGCVTRDEIIQTRLRKEIDDLLRAVVAMDAEIKAIEEGGDD
ncbi:hypothetical protein [Cohaesibacter celericrescens]|uniref:hypothetical protein n=1 Tax=Cohaesibacter celericrescens TaxID=2067669 RepID=UPI0015E15A41|nr:hypothetical protein [Cohaesibacter celericrescens]